MHFFARTKPSAHRSSSLGLACHNSVQSVPETDARESIIPSATLAGGSHNFNQLPLISPTQIRLQTRLKINEPGDRYEQEADRIADTVMQTSEPSVQRACECGGECPKCKGEEESGEGILQRTVQSGAAGIADTGISQSVHRVVRSSGQPLSATAASFFEGRFGKDLSQVRVHTGDSAAAAAQAVNARAFTLGQNIVFNKGEYRPDTRSGRHLLAHELVHTVQQRGTPSTSGIQRTIAVTDATKTRSPHKVNNGAVVLGLFNKLCPSISWKLSGSNIVPASTDNCDKATVQKGTTPTACECVCHFTSTSGPHANINVHATKNNTQQSTGTANSFDINVTGQDFTGMRGIRGKKPSSGSPLVSVPDPGWLILGHELCGHAKTTSPLRKTLSFNPDHQMSQNWDQTAVDIENRIRQEHDAAFKTNLGVRIGEFQGMDPGVHAGSVVTLPKDMSLKELFRELDVPVRYTYPRCVREDYFLGCPTSPAGPSSTTAEMRKIKVVNRLAAIDNGTLFVPWACVNKSFPKGTSFNVEGVFWYRAAKGETKTTIAKRWGVSIAAINRANRLFGNSVDGTANTTALKVGTMVVIPYKSAPGAERYFHTKSTLPC